MKTSLFLIAPLLCLAAGGGPEIDSAIDMARAAPGEFAADAIMRIAALPAVEKTRKIRLLEEASGRAAGAQEPYRRRAAIAGVGGTAGFLNRAYDQGLDAMTLKLRVIEALLALDKDKARDLFLQIPEPQLPKLKCSDFMVYDLDRYYAVLGRVAAEAFTPKEIEKGEPVRLLLRDAGGIAWPAQVKPMAAVIAHAQLKDADFQAVAAAYASALGKIAGDDRSFTAARGAGPAILSLVDEMKKRRISPLPLLESYRLYLVVHLSAVRCADDDSMQNPAQSIGLSDGALSGIADDVAYFNQSLRVPPLQLIQDAEVEPSRHEGAAQGLTSCEDSGCQAIAQQYRGLAFQPNGLAYSPADRNSDEWQARLQDFLNAMANWKPESGAEAEYYRNKCAIYSEILGLAPKLANQETVARAMLDFVERSQFQAQSRMQWFLPLNALLGRGALDSNGLGRLTAGFRQSRDPVVALYALLEALAPRGPEQVMPLL